MPKAAILAARFSGRARKRSLKRLSKMEADEKDHAERIRAYMKAKGIEESILFF